MDAQGTNGQLHFDGSTVKITRDGFGGSSSHLDPWSFPITGITEVVWHEPGKIAPGHISFVTAGHAEPGGYISTTKDEQSVMFKHKHAPEFEAIRDAVQAKLHQ
jgi:hypothetical protein